MLSNISSTKLLSAYTFSDFPSPPLQHNFHHVITPQASKPIAAIIPRFVGNTISSWQNTGLCHHPRQLRPALPGHRAPEPHAADAAGDRPLRSLPPARRLHRPRPPPSIPPILPLPTNTQGYASYAAASFGVLAGQADETHRRCRHPFRPLPRWRYGDVVLCALAVAVLLSTG